MVSPVCYHTCQVQTQATMSKACAAEHAAVASSGDARSTSPGLAKNRSPSARQAG
eukprot:CAMPEP_0170416570 /NCGR_PEP_ID=MMETSP0117_2-20130122/33231_1 /TAXON_ID=400756 /ORGANISM="Durinskia baltica, Strain CSIRO CS-38" /LENGTH=54 /DNA_ID=CAMNT_0010674653 /DNA_START=24 /DNA_END=184 /DNA_ORIENTATION=+